MAAQVQADQVLDVQGLACPLPIVKLAKAIRTMEIGQIIEMQATDPGSKPDVDAWVQNTGHELVHQEDHGSVFHFWLKKAK